MISLSIPSLAKEYHLIAMTEDSSHRTSLKTRLNRQLAIFLPSKINIEIDSINYQLNLRQLRKIRTLYFFLLIRCEDLMIGGVEELENINQQYNRLLDIHFTSSDPIQQKINIYILEKIHLLFKNTYTNFKSSVNIYNTKKKMVSWGAYEYVAMVNNLVCPYCNAQFVLTVPEHSTGTIRGKTRPDLDHFLSQREHPIFSISLYNLVPCCKICNSSFKGDQPMNIENYFSPFENKIVNKFRFVREYYKRREKREGIEPINYVDAILGESNQYKLKIIADVKPSNPEYDKIKRKVENNVKLFRLEDVYECHKSHVQEMIIQSRIYNEVYKQQLMRNFPKIFESKEEMEYFSITSENKMKSKVLSKVTSDIIKFEIKQSDIQV